MNETRTQANEFLDGQSPSVSLPPVPLVNPELTIGSRLSVLDSKGQQRGEKEDAGPHDTLNAWFHEHKEFPYPSRYEKNLLSMQTGLDMIQINDWFVDARVRKQSSMSNYEFSSNYSVAQKSATSTKESFRGSQYTETSDRSVSESGSSIWTDYLESDTDPCYEGCEVLDSLRRTLACRLLEAYQTRSIHAASIDHTGNRLIFREGVASLQLDNLLGGRSDHNVNHVQGSSIPTNNPGSQFTTNYNRAPESSTTQSVPFSSTTFNGADRSAITDTQDNFNTLYQPNAMIGTFYGNGQMPMNMEQGMGHDSEPRSYATSGQSHVSQSCSGFAANEGLALPSSGQNNGKKRARGQQSPDDGSGFPDDGRRPSKTPRNAKTNKDPRLLACPFYKKEPRKYRCCNQHVLREINRVK